MTLPTNDEVDSLCIQRIAAQRGISLAAAAWQYRRMNSKKRRRLQRHARLTLSPSLEPLEEPIT